MKMPTENLDNRQLNESTQESQENLTEQTLNNPESAKKTAESVKNSWDLDNLADKEISDVNTAKKLIKQKKPNLKFDGRKDYEIINQAKRIQKEAQNLRRFENRKGTIEARSDNPESIVQTFLYREEGNKIIININGSEVIYKKEFTTWNTSLDNKLDPKLKWYLDNMVYGKSLRMLQFALSSNITYWKENEYGQIASEIEAKCNDLLWKTNIRSFFDNPNNLPKFINVFKTLSEAELQHLNSTPESVELRKLMADALIAWNDYTFSYNDFDDGVSVSIDHIEKAVSLGNKQPSCNMEIIKVDNEWIHLRNTLTNSKTIFNENTFNKAKKVEEENKKNQNYIENKYKEIKQKLNIGDDMSITFDDSRNIETEMMFDAFRNDKDLFDIFCKRVIDCKYKWYRNDIGWSAVASLLKKFDINEEIYWRWYLDICNIDGKQVVKADFWDKQIYFWFGETPKITHEKITQQEINEKITEQEESQNYKRALNIVETSKYSWKVNLSQLNLNSKEVWNLFEQANLDNINNLEIDLSWNKITTVPKVLFQKKWIKSLDLNDNLITEISGDIFINFDKNKCSLESLHLESNNVDKIPQELFKKINKLKNFAVSNKRITEIPDSIWELTNLQCLNIAGTWITTIPNSISNCKSLEMLYTNNCNITELPKEIWNLTELKKIDLSFNNLSVIPDLSSLTNLEDLYISYNKNLKSIPEVSRDKLKLIETVWCNWTINAYANNMKKLYPSMDVISERNNSPWIDSWEKIKEMYFSWPDKSETLSWNPNDFFNDNDQYQKIWLNDESSIESWLSKAREELNINDKNIPIFYITKKRSDWTVSILVFTKKEKDKNN